MATLPVMMSGDQTWMETATRWVSWLGVDVSVVVIVSPFGCTHTGGTFVCCS